jgi:hypothetical protein
MNIKIKKLEKPKYWKLFSLIKSIILNKNDKYWFTWEWDVYRLDEFKSFFTYDYFKNQINSWSTSSWSTNN